MLARIETHLSLRNLRRALEERILQLERINDELAREITERERAEEAKQALIHTLGERVKELNCLYGMSMLVETPGISLDEILQGTADLIPPA
jgi:C4-dicarboxylate-specific signal transduction histidine kinase